MIPKRPRKCVCNKLTTALADKNVESLLKWLRGTLVKKELGDKQGVALLNKLITSL